MIIPPPEPPSGPKSTTQSAVLMTSRLCSLPQWYYPCYVAHAKCRVTWQYHGNVDLLLVHPRYIKFYPYLVLLTRVQSFTRCASPPERVVAA